MLYGRERRSRVRTFHPLSWAKPVPVNFGRLRRPKQDMFWVAAAEPGQQLRASGVVGIAGDALAACMLKDDPSARILAMLCVNGLQVPIWCSC